MDFLSIISTD